MEVILRENIAALGEVGDVVKVKDGYARNYLIPKRFAYIANETNRKRLEAEREALEAKQVRQKDTAHRLAAQIEALIVAIAKEAGEEDKLFGSVTAADVERALHKEGVTVDRKMITFHDPIRTLGDYVVDVRVYAGIVAKLRISVVKA